MLVGVCRLGVAVAAAAAVSAVARTAGSPGSRHRGVGRKEPASLELQRIRGILTAADVGHMIAGAGAAGAAAAKPERRTPVHNRRLACRAGETAAAGT